MECRNGRASALSFRVWARADLKHPPLDPVGWLVLPWAPPNDNSKRPAFCAPDVCVSGTSSSAATDDGGPASGRLSARGLWPAVRCLRLVSQVIQSAQIVDLESENTCLSAGASGVGLHVIFDVSDWVRSSLSVMAQRSVAAVSREIPERSHRATQTKTRIRRRPLVRRSST
jgi:hypothetical protein